MDRMVIDSQFIFRRHLYRIFEENSKRKLLSLLQKYLSEHATRGNFHPVGIDHYNYAIKLEGQDEPFLTSGFSYEGFKSGSKRWTLDFSIIEQLEQKEYHIKEEEFYTHRGISVLWSTTIMGTVV